MEAQRHSRYYYSFDVLRVIMILLYCAGGVTLPGTVGHIIGIVSSAAPVTFFVTSGYLVIGSNHGAEERLVRAIKRAAILFFILAAVYTVLNAAFYRFYGMNFAVVFQSRRRWFEFLLLDQWPFVIGEGIWFIQCLLYGYLVLYALFKLKLMKYDWIIMLCCMVLLLFTGELAGLVGFHVLGYDHIASTVLTRSVPYLLLGRWLRQKRGLFSKVRNIHLMAAAPIALCLSVLEQYLLEDAGLLVYESHFIGNGLFAAILCLACARRPKFGAKFVHTFMRKYVKYVYIVYQPMVICIDYVLLPLIPSAYYSTFEIMFITVALAVLGIPWLIFGKLGENLRKKRRRTKHKTKAAPAAKPAEDEKKEQ